MMQIKCAGMYEKIPNTLNFGHFSDVIILLNWTSCVSQISVYYRSLAKGVNWLSIKSTKKRSERTVNLIAFSTNIILEVYTFTRFTLGDVYIYW